jgi:phosphonate transport system substrate-binding protein
MLCGHLPEDRCVHPEPIPRTLRVASHLAPAVLPAYALAARRIGERLGRPADLTIAADYRRCVADVDHVCFVCSVPYVLLAGRVAMAPVAAPVLDDGRCADRPVYFSEVIVRTDAPYRSFRDLAGSRWAFNEPYSHSGFVAALHHLAENDLDASFIGSWIEAGFHDDAIHHVLDGRADWAAIDSQVLDLWRRWRPDLRRALRTVAVLGPSAIQPVVVSTRRLGAAARSEVAAALTSLHEDAAGGHVLRACGIARFVPTDDGAYDDIRRKLGSVEAAGLLPAWWRTRWDAIVDAARPGVSRRSPERAPARPPAGRGSRSGSPRPRTSAPRSSPSPS